MNCLNTVAAQPRCNSGASLLSEFGKVSERFSSNVGKYGALDKKHSAAYSIHNALDRIKEGDNERREK